MDRRKSACRPLMLRLAPAGCLAAQAFIAALEGVAPRWSLWRHGRRTMWNHTLSIVFAAAGQKALPREREVAQILEAHL